MNGSRAYVDTGEPRAANLFADRRDDGISETRGNADTKAGIRLSTASAGNNRTHQVSDPLFLIDVPSLLLPAAWQRHEEHCYPRSRRLCYGVFRHPHLRAVRGKLATPRAPPARQMENPLEKSGRNADESEANYGAEEREKRSIQAYVVSVKSEKA